MSDRPAKDDQPEEKEFGCEEHRSVNEYPIEAFAQVGLDTTYDLNRNRAEDLALANVTEHLIRGVSGSTASTPRSGTVEVDLHVLHDYELIIHAPQYSKTQP